MSNENTIENVAATRLDEALATLIEKSVSGIDKASEFLVGEIPDVVYQLLLWHGVSSFIQFLIGVVLFTFIVWKWWFDGAMARLYQKEKEETGDGFGTMLFGNSCIGVALIPPLALINTEWLQIWIAPKVWLLEYAAQLVK
jgi:hypothetical protein